MKVKILFILVSFVIVLGCDPSADRRVACTFAIETCVKFEDSTESYKCLEKAFETVCNFKEG